MQETTTVSNAERTSAEFELALMRRSLAGLSGTIERCGHCHRTLLIGEQVFDYPSGQMLCALCRLAERSDPADTHRVRGPEFGHTIRVTDRRPRRAA